MRTYVMCLLAAGLWSTCASYESTARAQEPKEAASGKSAIVPSTELKPHAAAEAVQKLKGSWTIVAGVNQGEAVAADSLKGSRVIFGDDTIVVLDAKENELYKAAYKLSGEKAPFQIDMTTELPNQEPTKGPGLIELRDSGLKLCYALPGGKRPTKLESKEGSKHMFFEMKRIEADSR